MSRRIGMALLVIAILVIAAVIATILLLTPPTTERGTPKKQSILVEVTPVERQSHNVTVRAMGTVIPAVSIQLASRVSGEIIEVSDRFVPGGLFKTGQKIIQVDPEDYRLVVRQRTSDLTKAESDLKVEMGQQSVARREYELLQKEIADEDKSLVLREPHLAVAEANVAAAKAARDKAELDLKRTTVVAPFNLIVQSRNVNLGAQVAVGTTLASLVGTDKYWVQVTVPVDELKWIRIPAHDGGGEGSKVRVYYASAWGAGVYRSGTVERLMTSLEPEGRMAMLLVAVEDPLCLQCGAGRELILDSYVRVEIDGNELDNVAKVPRTALHDGDFIWVMKVEEAVNEKTGEKEEQKTLDIRRIETAWSDNDYVYVSEGVENGDLLVTSNIGAPVQGMALRTAKRDKSPGHDASETQTSRPENGQ